jgi:hypothetical protein
LEDNIVNFVCNITPLTGITSKYPPNGGEFVETTTLLEDKYPLSREQLRVKMNDDCWERVFRGSTKLTTLGEETSEEGRFRERGDSDTEGNFNESSFTDHHTSPLDFISTLPKIFNFDEGLILEPVGTFNLNTGASDSRILIWMTTSHLLGSFSFNVLPRTITLNKSFGVTEWEISTEELTVTRSFEEVEVRGVKMRLKQSSWYVGKIWKHFTSKWMGREDAIASKLES